MAMTYIWGAMILISFIFGALSGSLDAVSSAISEAAEQAIKLILSIGGMICFWSGLSQIMERSGISEKIANCLSPVLKLLFPSSRKAETAKALSENISANFLGLGNAATPAGIRAASLMSKGERASDELCLLIVINTASIQLIPSTIASVRALAGAEAPFDILPAVWLTSAVSLLAGLLSAKLLRRFFR